MRVCGIDPGRTTGLVVCDVSGVVIQALDVRDRESLVEFLTTHNPDVLVVEDFLGSGPRSADAIYTLKMLGFIEGCSHYLGMFHVMQPPQWRRAFLDKAQLVFPYHKQRHCKDALAHVLAYLDRTQEGKE